jgi:hypothetical protein
MRGGLHRSTGTSRYAGRVVAITGQITLQHAILNDGAPHKQDERDGGDVFQGGAKA